MGKDKSKEGVVDPKLNGQGPAGEAKGNEPSLVDASVLQIEIAQLKADLDVAKAALDAEIEAHATTLKDAMAVNGELQKKLDLAIDSVKVKLPTVDVDGETYQCKYAQINVAGKLIKAEDVCADVKLAKALIKQGSGMLRLVR
jgi:hypothetical protein